MRIGLREEALAGDGEGADDEDADEPDHDGDEDWDDLEHGGAIHDGGSEGGMVENGDGDAPPGEHGIHSSGEEPGAEEIPDFFGFSFALFGGEESGDAGEVDAAEGDGEYGSPAEGGEGEVAEQVAEGELGGRVVEGFEGEQGGDDETAEEQAA